MAEEVIEAEPPAAKIIQTKIAVKRKSISSPAARHNFGGAQAKIQGPTVRSTMSRSRPQEVSRERSKGRVVAKKKE